MRRRRSLFHGHRRESFIESDPAELVEIRGTFSPPPAPPAHAPSPPAHVRWGLHPLRALESRFRLSCAQSAFSPARVRSSSSPQVFDPVFTRVGLLVTTLALALLGIAFVRRRRSDRDFSDFHAGTRMDGVWGRRFRTSGGVVLALFVVVGLLEAVLLGLILTL